MVDPLRVLKALLHDGLVVFYMDTDRERLRLARAAGAYEVIDAAKITGRAMIHPEVLIAVHTDDWHPLQKKEYIHIGIATMDMVM